MEIAKTKKGQVSFGNITGAAVAIGVLIVVVTVFAILLADLGTENVDALTLTETNETQVSISTNITFQLDQSTGRSFSLQSGTVFVTNSSGATITNANFTLRSNGSIDLITDEEYLPNASDANFTYTYTTATSAARNVTENGQTFFQNLTSQVGLLGTILILVLIVVIIIGAFAFRNTRGRGGI